MQDEEVGKRLGESGGNEGVREGITSPLAIAERVWHPRSASSFLSNRRYVPEGKSGLGRVIGGRRGAKRGERGLGGSGGG